MTLLHRRHFLASGTCALLARHAPAAETRARWAEKLEVIRARYDLPALGAAIVTTEGCHSLAVTGVRKKDAEPPVTLTDLWHLGSNTKAMTATLAAIAVEEGTLRWDSTLGELFPQQRDLKKSPLAKATLTHLLSHRSGLPANAMWGMFTLASGGRPGNERAQRALALEMAARTADLPAPGTQHEYSNFGYVLAGHMLEQVWDAPWEKLMQQRIFTPLSIHSAGFGGTGTPGKIDQPWPHNSKGEPMPGNGPLVDNPPVLGPAGTVHMMLADWGRFLSEHLAGRAGKGRLLKTAVAYQHLHSATLAGENYAYGWGIYERPWGGRVLSHSGSNTMNHSVTWLAPEKGFGVLACTNSGAENAAKALNEVSGLLIQSHQKSGA